MKHFFLKLRAHWRRIQRGTSVATRSIRHADALDTLLDAANPFAKWSLRARWMAGLARWLRGTPDGARKLLDRLDERRDLRRAVRTTLQKTLREAIGPDLFSNAGLPHEPAVMGELLQRFGNALLPSAPDQRQLSALVAMMFPTPASTRWLVDLDAATLERLWKLCADDGIAHGLLQQADEALHYLASMVIAVGVSPEFQQRLTPRLAIQATPFMALRRELEKYLLVSTHNDHALRSVRMLIAVCQAQTDRIYAHLDEHGVSIGLVYRAERMRAQLARMSKLLDLRVAMVEDGVAPRALTLLADLSDTTQHRTTVSGLLRRSFALLARKMVERHGEHVEAQSVHGAPEYRRMLGAGARAGVPLVLAALVAMLMPAEGGRFLDGVAAAAGFTAVFA
ncbi:preprotein translocase subunit TatB, partial [Oxalobacteraceae bacterium OM1]